LLCGVDTKDDTENTQRNPPIRCDAMKYPEVMLINTEGLFDLKEVGVMGIRIMSSERIISGDTGWLENTYLGDKHHPQV